MLDEYNQDEIRRAHEIAHALDDYKSIRLHLQHARMYNESFLRKQLEMVLAVPQHKIIKSRAAYYTSMVKSQSTDDDLRH